MLLQQALQPVQQVLLAVRLHDLALAPDGLRCIKNLSADYPFIFCGHSALKVLDHHGQGAAVAAELLGAILDSYVCASAMFFSTKRV